MLEACRQIHRAEIGIGVQMLAQRQQAGAFRAFFDRDFLGVFMVETNRALENRIALIADINGRLRQ